jgi:two-component system phosphate regulon response regulator PhoB
MAQRSVLIVEDDIDIVELLEYNLSSEGFSVETAGNGETALENAKAKVPDLILLDLGLPGMQGLDVCRILRQDRVTSKIPIIMLTARGEESDIVVGLELGADDYIPKPFGMREVIARIRAVLRRRTGSETVSEQLAIGPFLIDSGRYEVRISGKPIEFTLAEFRLLRSLASNPGRVLTREQLLDAITDQSTYIIDRNIDVHIRSIRQKIGEFRDWIVTVRGVGYKFGKDNL